MAVCTADFELGTNGSNVLTADTGSATAWNTRQDAANLITYSTTQAAHGTKSMKVDNPTGGTKYMQWGAAFGTLTDHYGRFNFYTTAIPASNTFIFDIYSGASQAAQIRLLSTGILRLGGGAGSTLGSCTVAIPTNQWIRIEYHIIHSATVGFGELKYWTTVDSSGAATETMTSAANKNTLTNGDSIRYGITEGTTASYTVYYDDIVAGATSYPGPAVVVSKPKSFSQLGVG